MKNCTLCGEDKPESAFHRRAASIDGLQKKCKSCSAKLGVEDRLNHPDRKYDQRYSQLRHKYGLNADGYDKLLLVQNGVCAICKSSEPRGQGKYFHVDHCHTSKNIRGLLCYTCNSAVGLMKDNPSLLRAAARYLEK